MINLPLIRNSERSDFKSCPAKWNWRWNMGLVPAHPRQDARWFGTQWHLLWATVYTPPTGADGFTRSITKPEEIHQLWDELTKNSYTTVSSAPYFDDEKDREYWDAVELGHIMIDGQLRKWNLDPGYEVLMPEQRFRAKIPFNKSQIERRVPYMLFGNESKFITEAVGTFDLPVRDHTSGRALVMILDWKSTVRKDNLKQANKDDQFGTYISVSTGFLRNAGLIASDEAVAGCIWSFAKKAKPPENTDENGTVRNKPKKEHYREALSSLNLWSESFEKATLQQLEIIAAEAEIKVWGEPSKRQGSPLFWREVVARNKHNRLRQISRIADDAEAIALVRNGLSPVLKSPGDHCNWCDFTDLCDIDEDGGDTETFIKDCFKVDDPYADHQQGAQNSKVIR